jgi:hypothetical protein
MPIQKHLTFSKLLQLLGYCKQNHVTNSNTGVARYGKDVFDKIDDPKVSVYEAQMYVAQRKDKINKLFEGNKKE